LRKKCGHDARWQIHRPLLRTTLASTDRGLLPSVLSLSIISGFLLLLSAPQQSRYLPDQNISVDRFFWLISSESGLAPSQSSSSDSQMLSGAFFFLLYQPLSDQ